MNNIPKTRVSWKLEFKLQDCWLGVYWNARDEGPKWNRVTDLWICLIPCFPLHIIHTRQWADKLPT